MRSVSLLLPLLALAACKADPPPAPPAPPTAAEDSVATMLADTATAGERYTGQKHASVGEGAVVHLWLRPDGQAVWAEDALNGTPLQPRRGTYDVAAGTPPVDTLTLRLPGDTTRFLRTADSLLETRPDTLIEAHLLRLGKTR